MSALATVVSALTAAARVRSVSSRPPGAVTVLYASLAAASARSALRMKLARLAAVAKCCRAECLRERLAAAELSADSSRLRTACTAKGDNRRTQGYVKFGRYVTHLSQK